MGPPGSGKGTQAELLAEKLNFYYLETSKVLETGFNQSKGKEFLTIKGKKYFFKNEKKLWKTGKLCSPPLVTYLIKEKIEDSFKEGKNLVLAGSPRSLYEGERIVPLLKKLYGQENTRVIFLEILPEASIFRNSHRRICQLFRHPILYSKETAKLKKCPLDGSKLLKRKELDDPKTIKIRLKEYQERTFPLIDFFKKEELKVTKIDGSPPPADVFKAILKASRFE
jgi:adenylate kinase